MTKHIPAVAVLILAAATGPAWAEPPTAQGVLAANRAAVGEPPRRGTETLEYAYAGQGLSGVRTVVSDVATGAFVDRYALGVFDVGGGYDGRIPWMRDLSGANTSQEGGDRAQLAVNDAYRNANRWWLPGHGGAAVAYAGRESLDGRPLDHLVVTPRGGKRFDAWFDAETHLLARVAEERMFFKTRVFFSDYARDGGVMRPRTIVSDGGTGEANYETMTLKRAVFSAPQPLSAYARPTAPPAGGSIQGGAASVTVPFRLLNNHIYVEARVNGKGPYTFLVDTGGHNLLSPRVADELGLRTQGAAAAAGAGEKIETSSYARVREIALGGVKLSDQVGIIQEIYDPAIEGVRVDGMVGFELFRRFAIRTDYAARTMTITDPGRFDPAGAGEATPFKFYDHLPQVEGRIDDLPTVFDIDSGSRSEVDVTSPFVDRHGLRSRYAKGVTAITGWGVGGPSRAYVVRLPSLTLGRFKVDGVVASLSAAKAGSFSDANFGGNIGSGFLKRFTVTYDYAHQRIYLKRAVPPPADAGRFDRSGMWINAGAHGYSVTYVSEGGPAAAAGLEAGDVIIAIDGNPAEAAALSDARTQLRALPAGTRLAVEIDRAGARRTVEIVLRDQI
jgi:predicted aspartyl protease